MHGPDVSDLEKALAEYKDLRDVNQDIVVQAEALLKLLRILKDDNNLDDLEEALRQVYDVKMPKNGNVQKAEDTLVSHYGKGGNSCQIAFNLLSLLLLFSFFLHFSAC